MEMEIHEKQEDQLTENGTSNSSSSSDDNDSDHAVEKIREKDVDCAEDMLVVGPPELVRRESRPGAFREGGSVELDLTNTPCTLFHSTNSADVVHMLRDLEQTSLVTATLVEEGETAEEFEQSTQRHEYVHAEPVIEKKENQQKTGYWKSFSCKAISLACILALILAVAMAITEARKARRIFNEKSASSNDSTDVGNGLSFSPSGDNSNNTNVSWNVAIWGYVTNCEKYQPQSLKIFCSNGGMLDIIDTSNSTSCVVLDSNAEALCTTSVAMGVAIFQCSGRSSIATAYYPHSAVLICRNHMNEEEIDAEHSLFTYGGNATVYLSVGRFCQTSFSKQLTVKTSAICELGDKEQSLCVDRHTCSETQACEWKNDQWDLCEGDDECHFQLEDLAVSNEVEQSCDLDEVAESIEIDELWSLVWSDLHLAKDNVERGST